MISYWLSKQPERPAKASLPLPSGSFLPLNIERWIRATDGSNRPVEHSMVPLEMNSVAQSKHTQDRTDAAFTGRHDRSQKKVLSIGPDAGREQRRTGLHPRDEIRTFVEQHPPVLPSATGQSPSTPKRNE